MNFTKECITAVKANETNNKNRCHICVWMTTAKSDETNVRLFEAISNMYN